MLNRQFAEMHESGTFLLVNVSDAGAAAVAQAAGAPALGTTSAGHAYSVGRQDAIGALTRDEAVQRAAEICAVARVPVSVDAENGWGHDPADVAETVRMLASVGAAGVTIEDWSGDPERGFYGRGHAVERIVAAVEAVKTLPEPFVVCARADAFLHGAADPRREAITRLQAFAAAGAPCLYAPGPRDRQTLATIVAEAGGPVNALVGVGSTLTLADTAEIGVRRVSVGGSLYRATMACLSSIVRQIVTTGSFAADPPPLPDAELADLLAR
jgi:2-methylisocitrate lyase-like PEP mutase family enzyme